MQSQSQPVLTITAVSEIAEVRTINGIRSLFALGDFKADEPIVEFSGKKLHTTPNYLTVQVGENAHIELMPEYLECINHSCDPNCFFDTTAMELVALKDIEAGEEFTFFYPSAEWAMDQSFKCNCGTKNCLRNIKGAKYLDKGVLHRYRFTDFIQKKLKTAELG